MSGNETVDASAPRTESAADVTDADDSSPAPRRGFWGWILSHDDSWIFTILYVGLAVYLSIAISLFWLVAVVMVHAVFEWVRQAHIDRQQPGVLARTAWHLKLDFALVIFALSLDVYMGFLLGAAGLGGAARLTAQAGARFAGWTRAIRGIMLSIDDAAHVARAAGRAITKRGNGEDGEEPEDMQPWRNWGVGDHIAIWLGVLCVLAILAAPLIPPVEQTWAGVWEVVTESFHPWPAGEE
jgi:hypothetical protein